MSKADGMTNEEAAAIVTLVKGGWLRLELTDPAVDALTEEQR